MHKIRSYTLKRQIIMNYEPRVSKSNVTFFTPNHSNIVLSAAPPVHLIYVLIHTHLFLSLHSALHTHYSFPGFCRVRMHNKGGSPVAFIEYTDVNFAVQAMTNLNGSYLASSDRGPIRIEYAKTKMAEVSLLLLLIIWHFCDCVSADFFVVFF
uniref:RRM domain-containing protein n=1 Tax=Cacopsylla melanoneura TaxID=428564 RepID=A0A8D9B876_9HEMI